MPAAVRFFFDGQAIAVTMRLTGENVIDGLVHDSSDI